jgi:hypothetical protein
MNSKNPLNNPQPAVSLNEELANLIKRQSGKPNASNKATLASKLKQRSRSRQNKIKKRARELAKQLTEAIQVAGGEA